MAAPPKPWEMTPTNSRIQTFAETSNFSNPSISNENRVITPGAIQSQFAPPPLPPRPCQPNSNRYGLNSAMPYGGMGYGGMSSYGNFGGYGGYNSYGGGYGGGYGGFGSQGYGGMYGGGFNRMNNGMFGDVESQFIQLAEENSRPAFQSIESVVGAVGSIAMMLENTFFAMTSSFRAILGVADNFGRLRSLFAQVWSSFAVIRGLNWLIKKLLVLLGIRTEDEFKAWAEASMQSKDHQSPTGEPTPKTSSWPAVLFIAVIAAVPYIIVKMLGSINATIQGNVKDPSTWRNPMQALAQFDFTATSPQEVSFRAHQILTIAPQDVQGELWNSGWLLGSVDQKTAGLVPVNYFKIIRNPNSAPSVPSLPTASLTAPISNVDQIPNMNSSTEKVNSNVNNSFNTVNEGLNTEPIVKAEEKCNVESQIKE